MSGTIKQKCICANTQQDKMYGNGIRIANKTKDGSYRCTVCGIVHQARYTEVKSK